MFTVLHRRPPRVHLLNASAWSVICTYNNPRSIANLKIALGKKHWHKLPPFVKDPEKFAELCRQWQYQTLLTKYRQWPPIIQDRLLYILSSGYFFDTISLDVDWNKKPATEKKFLMHLYKTIPPNTIGFKERWSLVVKFAVGLVLVFSIMPITAYKNEALSLKGFTASLSLLFLMVFNASMYHCLIYRQRRKEYWRHYQQYGFTYLLQDNEDEARYTQRYLTARDNYSAARSTFMCHHLIRASCCGVDMFDSVIRKESEHLREFLPATDHFLTGHQILNTLKQLQPLAPSNIPAALDALFNYKPLTSMIAYYQKRDDIENQHLIELKGKLSAYLQYEKKLLLSASVLNGRLIPLAIKHVEKSIYCLPKTFCLSLISFFIAATSFFSGLSGSICSLRNSQADNSTMIDNTHYNQTQPLSDGILDGDKLFCPYLFGAATAISLLIAFPLITSWRKNNYDQQIGRLYRGLTRTIPLCFKAETQALAMRFRLTQETPLTFKQACKELIKEALCWYRCHPYNDVSTVSPLVTATQ